MNTRVIKEMHEKAKLLVQEEERGTENTKLIRHAKTIE